MSNGIIVKENTLAFRSCACCGSLETATKLWDIHFTLANATRITILCEKHLNDLKNQIDKHL